jgi:cohesin loading factor subunit SCC2
MVVEADPSVLGRTDMQLGVKHSFLDHSTSVREAAVDLVGKFVLSRPDLIDKYYDMLSQRILVSTNIIFITSSHLILNFL